MGIAASVLAFGISVQIPAWAWRNGGRWSLLHGFILVLMQAAALELRIADLITWIVSVGGSLFSVYLGESVEYPIPG